LDEGARVINTLCEKIIILDFVSGDIFFPRVLIYPNTFIQGQYVYNTNWEYMMQIKATIFY
jgi:hypothetical protein